MCVEFSKKYYFLVKSINLYAAFKKNLGYITNLPFMEEISHKITWILRKKKRSPKYISEQGQKKELEKESNYPI